MKPIMMSVVLFSTLSVNAMPNDGKEVGNGGGGVVCRENGKIKSAELLDLFEAYDFKLTVKRSTLPAATQFEAVIKYLAKDYDPKWGYGWGGMLAKNMRSAERLYRRDFTFISEGRQLEPTQDIWPTITQRGCNVEQIANYLQNGDLKVDPEIYAKLPETDRAALKVHELIYRVVRNGRKLVHTKPIRKLVAFLFSKEATDQEKMSLVQSLNSNLVVTQTKLTQADQIESLDFNLAGGTLYCKSSKSNDEAVYFEMTKTRVDGVIPTVNNQRIPQEKNRAFWGYELEVTFDQMQVSIKEEDDGSHAIVISEQEFTNIAFNGAKYMNAKMISEWSENKDEQKFICTVTPYEPSSQQFSR